MAKNLTEKQALFLEHLFGEAAGNAVKAKHLAGYGKDVYTGAIVKALENEILERTKQYLVENGPTAAIAIVGSILDPTQLGIQYKLAAAKDVLDRIGIVKTEKVEVQSGVFILPPKEE